MLAADGKLITDGKKEQVTLQVVCLYERAWASVWVGFLEVGAVPEAGSNTLGDLG